MAENALDSTTLPRALGMLGDVLETRAHRSQLVQALAFFGIDEHDGV